MSAACICCLKGSQRLLDLLQGLSDHADSLFDLHSWYSQCFNKLTSVLFVASCATVLISASTGVAVSRLLTHAPATYLRCAAAAAATLHLQHCKTLLGHPAATACTQQGSKQVPLTRKRKLQPCCAAHAPAMPVVSSADQPCW
jgi:hypothetical protein